MKFAQRMLFSALVAVAYAASLVVLVTGFVSVIPLSVGGMILTAAALMTLNWLWADYHRKQK